MKSELSTDDWNQLMYLPLDVFTFVAGIDEDIDDQEVDAFSRQLDGGPRLKNPLHREIMEDLARTRGTVAGGRDEAHEWLASLRALANRTRYGTDEAQTGAGLIMMPTGEVVATPRSFDVAQDLLKSKLDAEEYEYFLASLLFSAIEIAKASGGVGPDSISTEENVALGTFCGMFGVGPEAIPRHFS